MAQKKFTKTPPRHNKSEAQHKPSKEALKSSAGNKADDSAVDEADNSSASSAMPPSVANANAELAAGDTPTAANAKAMSARANDILQTAPDNPAHTQPAPRTQVANPPQLHDVDRAPHDAGPPAPAPAMPS